MSEQITIRPVGTVRAGRKDPTDDGWEAAEARIELDPAQFGPEATAGLSEFSHVEVVVPFPLGAARDNRNAARAIRAATTDWPKVGIFAQRGKDRPNRIGVDDLHTDFGVDGLTLQVRGLDAIDGTPVLDIKPVMKGFLPRGDMREPAWAGELMKGYW